MGVNAISNVTKQRFGILNRILYAHFVNAKREQTRNNIQGGDFPKFSALGLKGLQDINYSCNVFSLHVRGVTVEGPTLTSPATEASRRKEWIKVKAKGT